SRRTALYCAAADSRRLWRCSRRQQNIKASVYGSNTTPHRRSSCPTRARTPPAAALMSARLGTACLLCQGAVARLVVIAVVRVVIIPAVVVVAVVVVPVANRRLVDEDHVGRGGAEVDVEVLVRQRRRVEHRDCD